MKNKLLYIISLCIFLILIPFNANGTIAYPKPITVIQPDGTAITIQVHGDEFLHWTTSNGRLVEQGKDGFYYYASFNEDGTIKISTSRATSGSIIQTGSTVVRPPHAAIIKAKEARKMHAEDMKESAEAHIGMGERHFLVLLVEFSDLSFTIPNPNKVFSEMLNVQGYSKNDGTGSARDYYIDNSSGQFSPIFDVYGPIQVSEDYAEYGRNEASGRHWQKNKIADLLKEACSKINKEVDFSKYDTNNDGDIDNVFFFFAGHNEAEGGGKDCIWPHSALLWKPNIYLDGVRIDKYACYSEYRGSNKTKQMVGIGTFCHEFGHVLGLPDLYDTDADENGRALGLRHLSLMSTGNYNNNGNTPPYLNGMERMLLGWSPNITLLEENKTISIENISTNKAYMTPTNTNGEFYMYENRQKTGWDAYIGTSGLVVYHVDQSNNIIDGISAKDRWFKWEKLNAINVYSDHPCFDLVESVFPETSVQYDTELTFPGKNNVTSITGDTKPGLISWDNEKTGYNIYDITNNDEKVTLRIEKDNIKIISGSVKNSSGYPLPNVNITLTTVTEQTHGASSVMVAMQNKPSYTTVTDSNGEFTIDLTETGNTTFQLNVSLQNYIDYNESIEIQTGIKKINITLNNKIESKYIELKKHKGSGGKWGSDKLQENVWAKATFRKSELTDYINYKFKSIQFEIGGNSASQVIVFIKINDKTILEKIVNYPKFEEPNIVDVSSDNITIPANAEISIGYHIINSDVMNPIVTDWHEPQIEGGGYYTWDGIEDGKNWKIMRNRNSREYFHLVISAIIIPDKGRFSEEGINYIISPKNEYNAGDIFTFKLSESVNIPISVIWYLDNIEKSESSVTLTSGEHKIKAVATYPDGSVETSLLEIIVH